MSITTSAIHDTTLITHSRSLWFEYDRAILPAAYYESPCMLYNFVGYVRLSFERSWKFFDACIVLLLPCTGLLSFSELLVSTSSFSESEDWTWAFVVVLFLTACFWHWRALESSFFFDNPICCSTGELSKLVEVQKTNRLMGNFNTFKLFYLLFRLFCVVYVQRRIVRQHMNRLPPLLPRCRLW